MDMERGRDQSSCVRRLFSFDRKVGYMAWKRPRTALVGGKISDRSGYRISTFCHKVSRKIPRCASRAGSSASSCHRHKAFLPSMGKLDSFRYLHDIGA